MSTARDGQPFHITGTGDDGPVTSVGCVLRRIVVNTPLSTGTITVKDGSTTRAVITMGTTPFFLDFGMRISTSLDVTVSGTCDLTVVFD